MKADTPKPLAKAPQQEISPARRAWRRAAWVVLPVAVIIGAELFAQSRGFPWRFGYQQLLEQPPQKIDYLFAGTSRTHAAIDAAAFEEEYERLTGRDITAINMGFPSSRPMAQYLGMRRLGEERPELLEDTTVLYEAPYGMAVYGGTWTGWYEPGNHQPITSAMRAGDLSVLMTSQTSLEQQLALIMPWLGRDSGLIYNRQSLRTRILERTQALGREILSLLTQTRIIPQEEEKADIREGRGLLAHEEAVRRARELAMHYAELEIETEVAFPDWEETLYDELAELLRAHDGDLVFYEMPVSSVQAGPFETEIRRADKSEFLSWANAWSMAILDPGIRTTDEDFPDLWHMRESLAPEFSRALARAVVEAEQATEE